MFALHAVFWTEFESGWGSRPDGYSFHKDKETLDAFIKRVEAGGSYNEFNRAGTPQIVEVSKDLYDDVMERGDKWTNMNNKSAALVWKAVHKV